MTCRTETLTKVQVRPCLPLLCSCDSQVAMHTSAAMVRVRGPDPKLVKAAGTAFHKAENGVTIISGSGSTWPQAGLEADTDSCSHAPQDKLCSGLALPGSGADGSPSLLVVLPLTTLIPYIRSPAVHKMPLCSQDLLPMVRSAQTPVSEHQLNPCLTCCSNNIHMQNRCFMARRLV